MNRLLTILIFWSLGFIGGILGYFTLPFIVNFFKSFVPNILSKFFFEALIAGIIGSGISTVAVLLWASKSSKDL
jgi:hypothetical protein